MSELFPIIRRVRRPFLVADAPPVVVGNVEPVKVGRQNIQQPTANAEPPSEGVQRPAREGETARNDANVTSQRNRR